jgi:hypothetical protein
VGAFSYLFYFLISPFYFLLGWSDWLSLSPDKRAPLAQWPVQEIWPRAIGQVGNELEQMAIGISEKYSRRWHPAVDDRLLHRALHRSARRMDRLDPTLAQPRQHIVNVTLSHAEGDVVLGGSAMNNSVDTEQPEHPAGTFVAVKKQSTRSVTRAKAELESELVNVERNCATQVSHWKVHLVKTMMHKWRHDA